MVPQLLLLRSILFARLMPFPRSVTTDELLKVLAHHERYGIESGVWYLLVTPAEHHTRSRYSLCQRFGLSQDQMEALLEAAGLPSCNSKAKATAYTKRIQDATSKYVNVYRQRIYCDSTSGQYSATPTKYAAFVSRVLTVRFM